MDPATSQPEPPLPATLAVALKEWAIVCRALTDGTQCLLLRKGGIYESAGEFELEHRRFLLFPTYLHQDARMLKAPEGEGLQKLTAEPARINLFAAACATDILPVTSRAAMDALDQQHIWAKPLIDMRFHYKPQNPLYLLLMRIYVLKQAVTVVNTPAYAGCKSWVNLESPVVTAGAIPVLDDSVYEERRNLILDTLKRQAVA